MFSTGNDGSVSGLALAALALLGLALSPALELLIARLLPRLGEPPRVSVRITTAAITAAACAAFSLRFGISSTLPAFIFLAFLGVQLARIDAAQHLLPNPLVLLLLTGGFLLLLTPSLINKQADDILRATAGAAILFICYLILAIISPAGIGMGDVKLAAPVGLYLGYLSWDHLLYGGLLGFILNGIFSLAILGRKRGNQATEVPHGPSMLAATAGIALFLA